MIPAVIIVGRRRALGSLPAQRLQLLLQLALLFQHVLQLSGQTLPLLVELLPRRSLCVEV